MDYKELFEKYQALLIENNNLREEVRSLKARMHYSAHGKTAAEIIYERADWISKFDEFMKISERKILTHAGKVSHEIAMLKSNEEFEKFNERTKNELSPLEKHFIESINDTVKQLKERKRGNK